MAEGHATGWKHWNEILTKEVEEVYNNNREIAEQIEIHSWEVRNEFTSSEAQYVWLNVEERTHKLLLSPFTNNL